MKILQFRLNLEHVKNFNALKFIQSKICLEK